MITLKQVEALYWIANLGSFDAASAKLHTSQAAISKRIRELESDFGVELFDRTFRTARLTAKGEELLASSGELLRLRDQIVERLSDPAALERRFDVGVTELTAITWLPKFAQEIRKKFPQIAFAPKVDTSANLYKQLQEGTLDFVIAVAESQTPGDLTSVHLGSPKADWVCSPDLVKSRKTMTIADLSEHTLLTLEQRSGWRREIDRWMKDHGVRLQRTLSSNSMAALNGLAVAGLGIAYIPRSYSKSLVAAGLLTVVKIAPQLPDFAYVAVYRTGDSEVFNESIVQLAKACCDFANTWGPHK